LHDFCYALVMTQSDVSAFSDVLSERPATKAVAVRAGVVAATIEQFIFGAAILGVAWVPFWFGSNREIAWLINASYFGVLVLLLETVFLVGRRAHPVALKRVAYPAAIFALACVWIVIQASTWIPAWLENPIYQYGRETLNLDLAGSITINRELTYMALLRLLTEGAVFWLFLQLCRSPQRAHWTVQAVAIIGMAYAIYGIVAFFVFPGTILWLTKYAYLDSVTSTFINRNSYATYTGIGLVCALACTFSAYVRSATSVGRSALRRAVAFVASSSGAAGWWMVGSFILSLALVRTGSRGGIMASVAGLLALIVMTSLRGRNVIAAIASLLGLLAAGVAIFVFGDFFAGRLLAFGFNAADRLAVYKLTILSILDAPWKGFGYGTFEYVFPLYRDNSLSPFGVWDKAHNTYLEMVQGLGIPVAALFLSMLLMLAVRCGYAALTRISSATAPLVATAATVIVVLHSFVDFSMQIQAVALTWTALLGAGVAQSWSGRVDTSI
jgi:O-antigen ligase